MAISLERENSKVKTSKIHRRPINIFEYKSSGLLIGILIKKNDNKVNLASLAINGKAATRARIPLLSVKKEMGEFTIGLLSGFSVLFIKILCGHCNGMGCNQNQWGQTPLIIPNV